MFLELIALDKDHSETVVAAACGLVGYVLTKCMTCGFSVDSIMSCHGLCMNRPKKI